MSADVDAWLLGPPRDERDLAVRVLIERCAYGAAALAALPQKDGAGALSIQVAMVIGVGEEYRVEVPRESAVALLSKLSTTVGLVPPAGERLTSSGERVFATTLALGIATRLYYERAGEASDHEIHAAFARALERAKSIFDAARVADETSRAMAERAAKEARAGQTSARTPRAATHAETIAARLTALETRRSAGELSELAFDQERDAVLADL